MSNEKQGYLKLGIEKREHQATNLQQANFFRSSSVLIFRISWFTVTINDI